MARHSVRTTIEKDETSWTSVAIRAAGWLSKGPFSSDTQRQGQGPCPRCPPAGPWGSVSVTADDRTFTVAAATTTACPSSTPAQTRFYQFNVTSTGHVTGLRAVGQPVTGEAVSEFAASPDGTEVAYAEQGCLEAASAALNTGVVHVMNLTSGAVRSWHNTGSAHTTWDLYQCFPSTARHSTGSSCWIQSSSAGSPAANWSRSR